MGGPEAAPPAPRSKYALINTIYHEPFNWYHSNLSMLKMLALENVWIDAAAIARPFDIV